MGYLRTSLSFLFRGRIRTHQWSARHCSSFIPQLIHDCFDDSTKLIESPQSIGYRSKMRYDFSYLHEHGPSDLGADAVNALCLGLYRFACDSSSSFPFSFWREVMVQQSRRNRFMVALSVYPQNETEHRHFTDTVAPEMVRHLRASTEYGALIDSVVFQRCPSATSKPSKYDECHALFGDGFLSHSTAVADISVSMRCGAFCEPNLEMERKQFEVLREWIDDLAVAANDEQRFVLIGKGREIIPYILEVEAALQHRVAKVIAISPCKLIFADAQYNLPKRLRDDIAVHCHYSNHRDHADLVGYSRFVLGDSEQLSKVFVVTAGRNGLSLEFVEWVKSLRSVERVVYSSCNAKVTLREMQWFLSGDDGFVIDDFRTLQMHPSTPFSSFFAVLKKKRTHNRTLIVPVGPFKVGKTHFIEEHLKGMGIAHFHRDRVFAHCKAENRSFRESKQRTHSALCEALTAREAESKHALYVDSTNTKREQRLFYCELFEPDKVIAINFVMDAKLSEAERTRLIQRLVERGNEHQRERGMPESKEQTDILRNIIAERVLGLPQDVRLDKDGAFRDLPTGSN